MSLKTYLDKTTNYQPASFVVYFQYLLMKWSFVISRSSLFELFILHLICCQRCQIPWSLVRGHLEVNILELFEWSALVPLEVVFERGFTFAFRALVELLDVQTRGITVKWLTVVNWSLFKVEAWLLKVFVELLAHVTTIIQLFLEDTGTVFVLVHNSDQFSGFTQPSRDLLSSQA